jgi:hypothetical protein
MFISIWLLLFFEGIFQGLIGISLYSIVFLIYAKRSNLITMMLVFLPVGLALDFILLLPIGTNWFLSVVGYFLFLLVEKFFQGISGFGLFMTSYIVFIGYYFFKEVIILTNEGANLFEYIKWSTLGNSLLSGLIAALIFTILRGIIDLIAKPKGTILKLK